MPQDAAELVDPDAINTVREILQDLNPPYVYGHGRVQRALQDHRQTVLFRDPGYASSGVNPYLWYRGKVHVPPTNPDDSLLQAEPGARIFQAQRHVRHWDALGTIKVWQNGVAKTITTDYTVNYPTGRVTFVADVNDWETVNASFSYYRVYHAAKQCLSTRLAMGGLVSIKLGNDSFTRISPKQALEHINQAIADIVPRNIRYERRMY